MCKSDDLISRQAAIDAIVSKTNSYSEKELRAYAIKHSLENGWTGGIIDAMDAVINVPSAQPERKNGKWIDDTFCSECGWIHEVESGFIGSVKQFSFCPNCGADMR